MLPIVCCYIYTPRDQKISDCESKGDGHGFYNNCQI